MQEGKGRAEWAGIGLKMPAWVKDFGGYGDMAQRLIFLSGEIWRVTKG